MVDSEITITLVFMTCIVNLDACELHPEDEKVFNDFMDKCSGIALYIC